MAISQTSRGTANNKGREKKVSVSGPRIDDGMHSGRSVTVSIGDKDGLQRQAACYRIQFTEFMASFRRPGP